MTTQGSTKTSREVVDIDISDVCRCVGCRFGVVLCLGGLLLGVRHCDNIASVAIGHEYKNKWLEMYRGGHVLDDVGDVSFVGTGIIPLE